MELSRLGLVAVNDVVSIEIAVRLASAFRSYAGRSSADVSKLTRLGQEARRAFSELGLSASAVLSITRRNRSGFWRDHSPVSEEPDPTDEIWETMIRRGNG